MKTFIFVFSIFVASSNWSVAQVIYNGTPEQRKTGVYKSTLVIRTDAETGWIDKKEVIEKEQDVKVVSCVEYDGGECKPSEYFKVTITDVKG